jgi:hypothetical protein
VQKLNRATRPHRSAGTNGSELSHSVAPPSQGTPPAREVRLADRPRSLREDQHRPAASKPIDTKAIDQRIARRAQELSALEAEIQAYADPLDTTAHAKATESREQQRAAERAAFDAANHGRKRMRGPGPSLGSAMVNASTWSS